MCIRDRLKGCEIRAEDGRLVIGKGMLKFHDFIYLLMEEEEVAYQPKNRWQVLKAEFLEDDTNLDYKAYRVRFFLDEELELGENQMEMCRFYLREGSALRDSYKNFADMSTEYDTVNLICATAVSYTHLQKREEYNARAAQKEQKSAAGRNSAGTCRNGAGTVSYTHLL